MFFPWQGRTITYNSHYFCFQAYAVRSELYSCCAHLAKKRHDGLTRRQLFKMSFFVEQYNFKQSGFYLMDNYLMDWNFYYSTVVNCTIYFLLLTDILQAPYRNAQMWNFKFSMFINLIIIYGCVSDQISRKRENGVYNGCWFNFCFLQQMNKSCRVGKVLAKTEKRKWQKNVVLEYSEWLCHCHMYRKKV